MLTYLYLALVLARIYVNQDTTKIYKDAFQLLFNTIHDLTGIPVEWRHIHGRGFWGMVADMCRKQATGKFRY